MSVLSMFERAADDRVSEGVFAQFDPTGMEATPIDPSLIRRGYLICHQ